MNQEALNNALIEAAEHGLVACVEELLRRGADLRYENTNVSVVGPR